MAGHVPAIFCFFSSVIAGLDPAIHEAMRQQET
jgi:hypothetical protein